MNGSRNSRFAPRDPFGSGRVELTAACLRFGNRSIAPGDVVSFRIGSGERSGFLGNILGVIVFLSLAALFLSAIVGHLLPYRSLIAVATLVSVALASCQDTWLERGSGFYELFVRLRTGRGDAAGEDVMVFASSERREMEAVANRLAEILVPFGAARSP